MGPVVEKRPSMKEGEQPQPPSSPQDAKPVKPKPPKLVYYNIVGVPVDSDDE